MIIRKAQNEYLFMPRMDSKSENTIIILLLYNKRRTALRTLKKNLKIEMSDHKREKGVNHLYLVVSLFR